MPASALPLFYGADNGGIVCAYAFNSGHVDTLSSEAAAHWLQQHHPAEAFLWIHVNLSHNQALPWLQQHTALPETFYESLQEHSPATRIERDEDTLLAVINDVLFDFTFESDDIATLCLAVQPQLMVTARRKPLRSVDRLRMAVKMGETPASTIELLVHLLQDQADELGKIVHSIDDKTNRIEDRILANRIGNSRADLGNMRRLLVQLKRLLAPEPGALFRLLMRPPKWISEADRQELRQSTEEFASVIQDISALQERIKLLQEEIGANLNEQNNRSLYVLTIVTVLALPFNIIGGLFGMNVGGIPLAENPHGFGLLVLLVSVGVVAAAVFFFRRRQD
jgi:zinc transporter